MAFIINVISECSNVGKTTFMEGLIKEIKKNNFTCGTIKHDGHDFEIDKKGKDTYRHRKAGADSVIISSKSKFAIINEVSEEAPLSYLLELLKDKDFILVEGYKNSDLKKIELYREGVSSKLITPKENLLLFATDCDYKKINDLYMKKNNETLNKDLVFNLNNYSEVFCYLLKLKNTSI